MGLREELERELDETQQRFIALVESIPEREYSLPTDNPSWSVGEMLHHITLGPRALAWEVWMIIHARGLFQMVMKYFPSRLFNLINARFARRGKRISRRGLIHAYRKAHAAIRSGLMRVREEDFAKSVIYPRELVSELEGEVTVERLFRYVKGHFEVHRQSLPPSLQT